MNTQPCPTSVRVRAPWPDELARVMAAFPELARFLPCHPLLLLAGDGPERIVAAAAVGEPDRKGVSAFSFAARARWLASEACAPLFAAIEATATGLGARGLMTVDDLNSTHPAVDALLRAGFVESRRIEFWSTHLPTLQARIARIDARLASAGRSHPFVSETLAERHLPAVRTLMAAEGMFAPEEVTLKGAASGRGFDPRYSFVVHDGGELAGAILVRRMGDVAFVDGEAVGPAWRGGLNLVHHRLYASATEHGLADGITTIVYTVDTLAAQTAHRMARRTDSYLKRTVLRLIKDL